MIVLDGVSLQKLLVASGNRHKYKEFQSLLAPLGIELVFGGDYERPLNVEETGTTFLENAALKACAWAKHTGLPSISDDSGIEVRALNWQPGIYSSRVGGEDDETCRQWLISSMLDKSDRFARYAAALVLAFPDGCVHWQTLTFCNGRVIQEKRGQNGFGYDSLFIPEGYNLTFGELPTKTKAKLSHRAKASQAFIEMLRNLKS